MALHLSIEHKCISETTGQRILKAEENHSLGFKLGDWINYIFKIFSVVLAAIKTVKVGKGRYGGAIIQVGGIHCK